MQHTRAGWVSFVIAIFLMCGGAVAAAEEALDYWPHTPGMTWVYVNEQNQQRATRIVGQDRLDDEIVTVTEYEAPSTPTTRSYYAIRAGQVVLVAHQKTGEAVRRPPAPVVMWPATAAVGTRWRSVPSNERSPEQIIERREKISVPAGTYEALVISSRTGQGPAQFTTTQWRAPGVGLVRSVTERSDGSRQITELVRFETGDGE